MAAPFRLSLIDYLNAAPLNFGFLHGLGEGAFRMVHQVPSRSAEDLRAGRVDAGLVSSIELFRIPGLRAVPGLCISSPKRVRSVLLLSKVPPDSIRRLALDLSSRSSVVLARILLRALHGADPEVVDHAPSPKAMLSDCDAAVLIGDPAMRARKEGVRVLDLAEEWRAWTGLPFVFALWGVREAAPVLPGEDQASFFQQSLAMGMANLDTIVEGALPKVGWTRQELREYFTENIRYHLGTAEQESLERFAELAFEHGFLDMKRPLRFL